MIKKFFHYLWSVRTQLSRYFMVGISGVVLDVGSLALLERYGVRPTLAVVVTQIFLLTYNFSLNKYWSFGSRAIPHRQLVRYLVLAGWNYLFSVGAMYIGNEHFGVSAVLVRLGSIALMTSWNFFLYKYVVYREDGAQQPPDAREYPVYKSY